MREKRPYFQAMIKDLMRAIEIIHKKSKSKFIDGELQNDCESRVEAYKSRISTLEKMIAGTPISSKEHAQLLSLPAFASDPDVEDYVYIENSNTPQPF